MPNGWSARNMNRFLEKDDVVTDIQTGLMWTKNTSLNEFPMTWKEAFNFIKKLNRSELYGFSDWKLPNRKELFSIISHETINPSLPINHPFVNIFNGYYWTSTTCARLPNEAWYVHLGGSRVFKGMKYNSYMVWPVRASYNKKARIFKTGQKNCYDENGKIIDCYDTGQDGELQSGIKDMESRFFKNANTILDQQTGLTWSKKASCITNWRDAMEFVEVMNQNSKYGFLDWRIPSILELESLTDMGEHSPSLPKNHPFTDIKEFYWSSTTSIYDQRYAWVLYMKDGTVGVGYKTLKEFYAWPVRGDFDIKSSV